MSKKSWLLEGRFGYGCDYNPDHWLETPEIIDRDIELMQQLGINTVNLGIFSWSRLEPTLGNYEFDWLNWVLDKLDHANIAYFMATPGAAFPPYLAHIYPEVLRVDRQGRRHTAVDRNNYCLTSPVLRKRLMLIGDKLAREVRFRPGLLGWHLNNELSGECCCDLCVREWQKFLRNKYRSLSTLNHVWWSDFSSCRFADWCEIPPPHDRLNILPGMVLDWQRFVSARQLDFLLNEKDSVTYWTPDLPVTHNSFRVFGNFDWRKFAPELDFASADVYMQYQCQPGDWQNMSYYTTLYSLYRNMHDSGSFALMETTASYSFVTPACTLKRPGQLEANILEAVANGADMVSFFQWRSHRGGVEQHHGAIITHDGRSDTRTASETAALGKKLQKIADCRTAKVQTGAAIWFDPENSWLIDAARLPLKDFHLISEVTAEMRALLRHGVAADVIADAGKIDRCKVLFAPAVYLLQTQVAEAMERFVKNGGTLILTAFSSWCDEHGLSVSTPYPGLLSKLAGLQVEACDVISPELGSIAEAMQAAEYPFRSPAKKFFTMTGEPQKQYYSRAVAELVHCQTAEPLAWWEDEFFADSPAVCCNQYGQGRVYYMAGLPCDDFRSDLVQKLIDQNLLTPAVPGVTPPEGVQFQLRSNEHFQWLFIINQSGRKQRIELPEKWQACAVELENFGAAVIKRPLDKDAQPERIF